jgi:uncharacterized glyoxalase superfamily protein PhnB
MLRFRRAADLLLERPELTLADDLGARRLRLADTSYGSREYGARDPEGHGWYFGNYRPNGTS